MLLLRRSTLLSSISLVLMAVCGLSGCAGMPGGAGRAQFTQAIAEPIGDTDDVREVLFRATVQTRGLTDQQLLYRVRLLDAAGHPLASDDGKFQNRAGEVEAGKTCMVLGSPWPLENLMVGIPANQIPVQPGMQPLTGEITLTVLDSDEVLASTAVSVPLDLIEGGGDAPMQVVWTGQSAPVRQVARAGRTERRTEAVPARSADRPASEEPPPPPPQPEPELARADAADDGERVALPVTGGRAAEAEEAAAAPQAEPANRRTASSDRGDRDGTSRRSGGRGGAGVVRESTPPAESESSARRRPSETRGREAARIRDEEAARAREAEAERVRNADEQKAREARAARAREAEAAKAREAEAAKARQAEAREAEARKAREAETARLTDGDSARPRRDEARRGETPPREGDSTQWRRESMARQGARPPPATGRRVERDADGQSKAAASQPARNRAATARQRDEAARARESAAREAARKDRETDKNARSYTVQEGDTLAGIALRLFNDPSRWIELYQANRDQLTSPDALRPGMVLWVKSE